MRYELTDNQDCMARKVAQAANVPVQTVRDGVCGWVESTWMSSQKDAAQLILYALCKYYRVNSGRPEPTP